MISITAVVTNKGSTPRAFSATAHVSSPGKCVAWEGCDPKAAAFTETGSPSEAKGAVEACAEAPCVKRRTDATKTYTTDRLVIAPLQTKTVAFLAANVHINGSTVIVADGGGSVSGNGGAFLPCALPDAGAR